MVVEEREGSVETLKREGIEIAREMARILVGELPPEDPTSRGPDGEEGDAFDRARRPET